jgi:molybdopterin-guanine dinucleotide biosynthesis protein A
VVTSSIGRLEPSADHDVALAAVVVLAGGGSLRLGQDKTRALIGGVPVLDLLLDGLAEVAPEVPVVVVGPERPTRRPVTWCREDPPGGGPVTGLARGLAQPVGEPPQTVPDGAALAVLAGDLPFAAPAVVALAAALHEAPAGTDCALGVDSSGDDQLLIGVHRAGPLRRAVEAQGSAGAVRRVVARLSVVRVPLPDPVTLDVDTADDLQRARSLAQRRL